MRNFILYISLIFLGNCLYQLNHVSKVDETESEWKEISKQNDQKDKKSK